MEDFFTLQGRLNRLKYLQYILCIACIGAIGVIMVLPRVPPSLQPLVIYPNCALLIWMMFVIIVKRLHDLGLSGWTLLVYFIVICIAIAIDQVLAMLIKNIFSLYLFLKKGDEGENEYGKDPLEEISSESNYKKKQAIEIIDNYDLYKDKNGQIEVVLHYLDEEENNPYLYISDKQAILYYSKNKTIVLDKFPQKYLKEIQKSPIILFYEVEGDDIIKKYAVKVNPE